MNRFLKYPFSRTLNFYIFKEFLMAFLTTYSIFLGFFFINQILLLAEEVLSRNVDFFSVILLLFYALPFSVALSAPFGTLVGVLMAIGKLSGDSEIIAMQSLGVSLKRVFLPVIALSFMIFLGSFAVNDILLPLGTMNYSRLLRSLILQNPELELTPFSAKIYQDSIIFTGDVNQQSIGELVLIDRDESRNMRVISSQEANLSAQDEAQSVLSLELTDVFTHVPDLRIREKFEYSRSRSMIYNLLLREITSSISEPGPNEMSSVDVWRGIQTLEAEYQERLLSHQTVLQRIQREIGFKYHELIESGNLRQESAERILNPLVNRLNSEKERRPRQRHTLWRLEFYQKFAIPLAALTLTLLGFPLAIYNRRSGKLLGFGVGIVLSVVFWFMLVMGRNLGIQNVLDPFWAMLLPNLIVGSIGLFFLYKRLKQ